MKKFADVEKTRKEYHQDGLKNSVHRASLLVPEKEGARTEISFVNHFLLKRGYDDVGCKITGLDQEGKRIFARLKVLDEPRVYTFPLTEMFEGKASNYMVEFFCGKNMYIPFPAVMINHYGEGFVNTVHAYNRVLNDVFEDDAINVHQVSESSIDVLVNDQFDTFVMFQAGDRDCKGEIHLSLIHNGENYEKSLPLNLKRFCSTEFRLSEVFDELPKIEGAVLKVTQPKQEMFYGRLLVGIIDREKQAFSANHSYYDTTDSNEYWEKNTDSTRMYPFLQEYQNIIRMYPIQARGELNLAFRAFGHEGTLLKEIDLGVLKSPSATYLEANLNQYLENEGLSQERVGSIELVARSQYKIPMRINHQLIFEKEKTKLFSSINLSLANSQVFQREGKQGFAWGQMIADDNHDSQLGVVFNTSGGQGEEVKATFFDGEGELCEKVFQLNNGQSFQFSTKTDDFFKDFKRPVVGHNIWYTLSSKRADLTGIVVTTHKNTLHTTGEHSY